MTSTTGRTYLDHAATTAVRPAALEAFTASALSLGNQSSLHSSGRGAKLRVATARDALAVLATTPLVIALVNYYASRRFGARVHLRRRR
mgnify:CR=1 FL=1